MASDVEWREAESSPYEAGAGSYVGPDAVVANVFAPLGEDWSAFGVTPALFHDAGDVVTVEGRYSGDHATSCKSLDCQFCHVWTLKDGSVVKFQQYTDTAQFAEVVSGTG